MLRDPLEKELHLPATEIKPGNRQGRKIEIVGEKDEQLVMLGTVMKHSGC